MGKLGKRIKSLREARGMTQDAFAEQLHVTRQTVSNYENGRSQPNLEMLTEIARVLNTDANTLLGAEANVPQTTSATTAECRKRSIRRLVINVAPLIALVLTGIPLREWADAQAHNFIVLPRFYMKLWFYPCVWALGGWVFMQTLEVFTGIHPLQKHWCRYAKWALLAGMFLPQIGLISWMSPFSSLIPIDIWMGLWTFIKQPAWYGIFGAALWLFGFLTGKQEPPIP